LFHDSTVCTTTFSGDSSRLISGSGWDSTLAAIHVWDVESGSILRKMPCNSAVCAVALSPTGPLLVAVLGWNSVDFQKREETQVWDMKSRAIITTLSCKGPVFSAVFSPNGLLLATGAGASFSVGCVQVWEVDTWILRQEISCTGPVCALTFSPDGSMLIVGSGWGYGRGTVQIWTLSI
jgi:WD40 repeat protein